MLSCLFALWFAASEAAAQDRFETAVEAWLEGDDAASLPVLADFARRGQRNARLLLARIETMDRGPSPYRLSLSATARRDLFRDMSGRSPFGRSWLAIEAEDGNRLADLLLRSRRPVPQLEVQAALWQAGERQATDYTTRIIALYGSVSARDALATNEIVLPELRPYLAYLSDAPEPRGDGLAALRHIIGDPDAEINADDPETVGMAGVLALGFEYGDMSLQNRWRPAVEAWLLSDPATQPIADLCRASCGDGQAACALAVMALSGGYYEVIRLDSPLERVIPQERFLQSPRARLMTLRRIALARDESNQNYLSDTPALQEMSQCVLDLVRDTRGSYGIAR